MARWLSVLRDTELGTYPLKVMGVALLGTYLIAINTTVLGVALPTMAADLEAPQSADWIITAYILALAVSMPASGWMADRLGRRRSYALALAVFAVGAAVSAAATDLPVMLVGRVLQGAGGGPVLPVGVAMIYELFPPARRGAVLGIWGIAVAAAPAVGPPLGGWLVTDVSWRWLFIALAVFAAVATVAALGVLKDLVATTAGRFDLRGWLSVATAMFALVLLSREGPSWGLLSAPSLALLVLAVVAGGLFVRWSLRTERPLLDVRVFRDRTFTVTLLLLAVFSVAQYTRLNFLPVELQVVRGLSPVEVGLLLAPAAVSVAVTMPLGGAMADRAGPRLPVALGLASVTATMAVLSTLTPDSSLWLIVVVLLGQGVGSGLLFSPINVTAMNAVRGDLAPQASTFTQLDRQIAAAVGTAVMGAVLVAQLGAVTPTVSTPAEAATAQAGYNTVFLLTTAVLGVALLLVAGLPSRRSTEALQAARDEEHRAFLDRLREPPER